MYTFTTIEHRHTNLSKNGLPFEVLNTAREKGLPYEVLATAYAEHISSENVPTEEEFNAVFCKPTLTYHLVNDGWYARFLSQAGHLEHPEPKPDDWYSGKHRIEDVTCMAAFDYVQEYQVNVEKVYFIQVENRIVVIRAVDEGYEVFVDTTPDLDFMIHPDIRNAIAFMKLTAHKNNEPTQYDELIQKYIDYSKAPL